MPAEWRQLSLPEFCARAQVAVAAADASGQLKSDIQSYAAELLLNNATYSGASYSDLWTLYQLGGKSLTPAQQQTVTARLTPSSGEVQGLSFADLQATLTRMGQCGVAGRRRVRWQPRGWGRMTSTLCRRTRCRPWWLCTMRARMPRSSPPRGRGLCRPRMTARIRFPSARSTSTATAGARFTQQSMTVTIGGQQVVQAKPGSWVATGKPVSLRAGEKTSLRVEYSYQDRNQRENWRFPGSRPVVVGGAGRGEAVSARQRFVDARPGRPRPDCGDTILRGRAATDGHGHGTGDRSLVGRGFPAGLGISRALFAVGRAGHGVGYRPDYLAQLQSAPDLSLDHFLFGTEGAGLCCGCSAAPNRRLLPTP